MRAQDAIVRIGEPGVQRHLREVAANQGEVMPVVERAYTADALHGRLVPDVAADRITRIGRVDDHAAVAHDLDGALYQARLRILGVNFEVLRHAVAAMLRTRKYTPARTPSITNKPAERASEACRCRSRPVRARDNPNRASRRARPRPR